MTITQEKGTKSTAVGVRNHSTESEEVMAYCQQCKALQTIWLNGSTMMPTQKFTQQGEYIYHNCGSQQPCRLYFTR
jgi:hypothetical protein